MSLMQQYDNPVAIAVIAGAQRFYRDARQAQTDATASGGYVLPANATPGKVANGYIVRPGDKVAVLQHGPKGSQWQIKGTVVKVNKRSITVDMRLKGRVTGAVRTERKAVANEHVWRRDWAE